ncbi:MAG: 16S rRNA (uracil(1498)-N(3))-methyltransferase [Planctomycetia bacterium]|nr:16S rRNA (uracil(1498)-N(3))-methyltransferase [Planctomycetia bacterium]
MADRYFVQNPIEGQQARLAGAEAHHLAHVMRAKPGHEVVLFDGSGAEFTARVQRVCRSEIDLVVISRDQIDRELSVPLSLGVALPKGDRQRWLVEKAVELGVARLVPLETERSSDRQSPAVLERLRRAVIEASKQCGRNRLMEIDSPRKLPDFLAAAPREAVRLLAHPGAKDCQGVLDGFFNGKQLPRQIVLAIGPEGGFTQAELDLALASGWQSVGFGPRILRVETAALALVATVTARMQHE